MSEKTMIYLKGYAQGKGFINTLRALNVATILHKDQVRKTGEPYIFHPVKVAATLLALGDKIITDELLATALLHDVIEDCDITGAQLINDYKIDPNIAAWVGILSKHKGITTKHYYDCLSKSEVCALVKISDRCHNISTMIGGFSLEKMKEYVEETEQYIIPLCKYVKDFYPQYSNQVFAMKYQLETNCKLVKYIITELKGE